MVEDNEILELLTIGEKLDGLTSIKNLTLNNDTEQVDLTTFKTPNADSVAVLLKQALRADDRRLILDCIFNQEEKVVANSVSILNLSEVLKFMDFLLPIINSKSGTVVASVLPWLKNLIFHHSSAILSNESALNSLNSLYQTIGTRVSTFNEALRLSASLDIFLGEVEDGEKIASAPLIYEDEDSEFDPVDEMDSDSVDHNE